MCKGLIYNFLRTGLVKLVNYLSKTLCPMCFNEEKNLEMINNKNAFKKNKFSLYYDYHENNFFNSTKNENEVKHILLNIINLKFDGTNKFYDAVVKIQR